MRRICKLALASLLLLTGCAGSGLLAGEPMGKQLDRALEEIKKDCIARGAPPFGPGSSQYSDTSCLMFTLKPWEPGDTPESAFAHSIKLPPPHDKPKDVYKPSMSSEEYFNALCKEEAGEWVFRRVEGVRELQQARPKLRFPRGHSGIVFSTSEKAHYMDSDMQEYFVQRPWGRYNALEIAEWESNLASPYSRYSIQPNFTQMLTEKTSTSRANYAFLWRGIRRSFDRENAIDGFEIIVYQIDPQEILAFQRGFGYRTPSRSSSDPRDTSGVGCTNSKLTPPKFIESVLIPSRN